MLYHLVILTAMMGQVAQAPPATQPVAETLPAAMTFEGAAELSGNPVDIEATDDGKLIIYGDPSDIEILTNIARFLDSQPDVQWTTKIFKLEYAKATELAPKIQQFWTAVTKPAKGQPLPEDRITIIPEARANMLMVAATEGCM